MGKTINISLRDLPKALQRRVAESREAVVRGARVATIRGKGLLQHRTPVDQGEVKAAWMSSGPSGAHEIASISNAAPHAGVVEAGARPHAVSYEGRRAIFEWVQRHFPGLTESEQHGIVEKICFKLLMKGQQPTYFVRNSIPDIEKFLADEVGHQLQRLAEST